MRLTKSTGCKKSPSGHCRTFCWAISSQPRHVSTIGKNLLDSNIFRTYPHNMVSFGPLAAEIGSVVWGTQANFNGFCVLASLLHGIGAVGVSQTLQHWTDGATYIRQGGHHVGHWPTFLVTYTVQQSLVCYVISDKDKILIKTSGYAMVVHGRPKTPKNTSFLGVTQPPWVVQPLYSRGHN